MENTTDDQLTAAKPFKYRYFDELRSTVVEIEFVETDVDGLWFAKFDNGAWNLFHGGTGDAVLRSLTPENADAALAEIRDVAVWSAPGDFLGQNAHVREQVWAIRKKYGCD